MVIWFIKIYRKLNDNKWKEMEERKRKERVPSILLFGVFRWTLRMTMGTESVNILRE